jgi:hypothetical protein
VNRCSGKPEIRIYYITEKENLICGVPALAFEQEVLGRNNDLLFSDTKWSA